MKISLPYSKNKRYLTGIDWIIHVLNYMTLKETGTGFMSQVILELHGKVDALQIESSLSAFMKKYPVLNGHTSRDFNLAPYWKIPAAGTGKISFEIIHLTNSHKEGASFDDVLTSLEKGINRPFRNRKEHVAFHLITKGGKSYVAMTFDHLVFDARNAEAFLNIFQKDWEGGEDSGNMTITEPAHLSMWMDKFKAGQRVNRAFLQIADRVPPRVLPLPPGKKIGFKFKILSFSREAAEAITENAFNKAGYLMLMPYALSASVSALHEIFAGRGFASGNYVIPVSIDTRKKEEVMRQVFFNNVSFFIFKVGADLAVRFPELLKSVKEQMYNQVKADLPGDICKASLLMRIAPLPLLGSLLKIYLKGQIASFSFSYVGETSYESSCFMDNKIINIFHMPRVPVPPGIGIFFQQSKENLNIILSYIDGMLTDEESGKIFDLLKSRLGVE
ncbi:MAG: hypothetical protein KKF00_14680 [Proteobacteria bacterium]|nr:hypothetical protein [Pseudomonadota bacterium]